MLLSQLTHTNTVCDCGRIHHHIFIVAGSEDYGLD
jgi:hypothetical protein